MVRTVAQRLCTTRHCSNSSTDKTFTYLGGDVPPPEDLHCQWHGPCFSSSIRLGTCGSQGCSPRAWSRAGTSAQEGGRPYDYDARTESHSGIDLTGDGGDRVWHADRRRYWCWEWGCHWRGHGEHRTRCPHWNRRGCGRRSALRRDPSV